jgi:hypothetical protein
LGTFNEFTQPRRWCAGFPTERHAQKSAGLLVTSFRASISARDVQIAAVHTCVRARPGYVNVAEHEPRDRYKAPDSTIIQRLGNPVSPYKHSSM